MRSAMARLRCDSWMARSSSRSVRRDLGDARTASAIATAHSAGGAAPIIAMTTRPAAHRAPVGSAQERCALCTSARRSATRPCHPCRGGRRIDRDGYQRRPTAPDLLQVLLQLTELPAAERSPMPAVEDDGNRARTQVLPQRPSGAIALWEIDLRSFPAGGDRLRLDVRRWALALRVRWDAAGYGAEQHGRYREQQKGSHCALLGRHSSGGGAADPDHLEVHARVREKVVDGAATLGFLDHTAQAILALRSPDAGLHPDRLEVRPHSRNSHSAADVDGEGALELDAGVVEPELRSGATERDRLAPAERPENHLQR